MNEAILNQVRERLNEAQRIVIFSHVRPDGDAVGSLLGLGLALQELGKDVQMVLEDGVPSPFRHLHGIQQIRKKPEGSFDMVILVDCADLNRVGESANGYLSPDLNIDHHITNMRFGKINLVDVNAAATSQILAENMESLGLPLTKSIADALLTGIITDTLGFRTINMTPGVLRVAADLMEVGGDLPHLYTTALIRRSYEAARYWGAGLIKLQREGPILWTSLSLRDRQEANYPGRDDADLINILASIDGVEVAMIFVEQANRRVKISWRAQPGLDVSVIAAQFGGGGHMAAAGAEVEGSLQQVQEKVLEATRALFMNVDVG